MLSSIATKPEEIGVKIIDRDVSCTNSDYEMREITSEVAMKTLKDMNINYSNWGHYMSGSENIPSSHLIGSGGESLI